ncbi:response regulator transcription factor [Actinomadura geliboluensis]|uniref:Response regulator transcription factor n=1 Tax=Actinomadura geliboluensis TaxID=882440 RepID=A0A5S4H3N5_9ACTN|nr:response regulator transcription factor [Actinomadura geliboluensis]TMR33430.1 response regulator transcription factor [Actinomadura geliboluensis]
MIEVLLADDQGLVRAGFRSILDDEDDITVTGEAADGEQAVAACRALRPDVALLDVRMPRMDGLEAARKITADPRLDGVHVVILTTFDLDEYVYGALRAGATGFLLKDTEPAEMIHAVRVAARGDALITPSVTRRLIGEFAGRVDAPEPGPRLRSLTDREREVMLLVAAGQSNDEIAERLVLSTATVKSHVSRIMAKAGARDRAQLVVMAYESGMVNPRWMRPGT